MVKYEKKPLKEVIAAADSGDKDAQTAMGLLMELGLAKDEMDFAEALSWYESAAKNGDGIAALSAATIYKDGAPGVEKNPSKSEEFYQIAKDLGFDKPDSRIPHPEGVVAGKKVLIVDQQDNHRTQMVKELKTGGFNPVCVSSLGEAQKVFLDNRDIHCIFVDIALSTHEGVNILAGLRKIRFAKDIPMVVVTKITDVNVIKKAKSYGINGWILKPIKDELVAKAAKRLA